MLEVLHLLNRKAEEQWALLLLSSQTSSSSEGGIIGGESGGGVGDGGNPFRHLFLLQFHQAEIAAVAMEEAIPVALRQASLQKPRLKQHPPTREPTPRVQAQQALQH